MGSGLLTDLYELTMTASYLRRGMTQPATFSLFVRHLPPGRGFLVAGGLEDALGKLEEFGFDEDDLNWLAGNGFDSRMVESFRGLRFTGDVWAIPEGSVVFAGEPLLEVTAPLPEAQLIETVLLNQLTYQTALMTKAARCRIAADGRAALVDFSFRRTHGIEAGMAAARATSIAGFAATSNVQAAHDYDIAATGTMAHSYIEAFAAESDAFAAFAQDFPDRLTFLIDTYDTLDGLRHALAVAERDDLGGGFSVRLDSGDLLELSVAVRKMLDIADRHDVSVVASGGLDEFDVKRLLDADAPIDVFGVGTRVGVSADAPSLDSAYKLVEYDGRPVMKLSTGKETLPGPKQVYRSGSGLYDVLTMRSENALVGTTPLLIPVMLNGERVAPPEPLTTLSDRLTADLDQLSSTQRALDAAPPTPVRVSPALEALAATVRNEHRAAR